MLYSYELYTLILCSRQLLKSPFYYECLKVGTVYHWSSITIETMLIPLWLPFSIYWQNHSARKKKYLKKTSVNQITKGSFHKQIVILNMYKEYVEFSFVCCEWRSCFGLQQGHSLARLEEIERAGGVKEIPCSCWRTKIPVCWDLTGRPWPYGDG